jgi:hypothetical protein
MEGVFLATGQVEVVLLGGDAPDATERYAGRR